MQVEKVTQEADNDGAFVKWTFIKKDGILEARFSLPKKGDNVEELKAILKELNPAQMRAVAHLGARFSPGECIILISDTVTDTRSSFQSSPSYILPYQYGWSEKKDGAEEIKAQLKSKLLEHLDW